MGSSRQPANPKRATRQPRQQRAVATRERLYAAAMAEYARVGVDAARVEDIVAAAGVSWGTFFHYFPAKEDVLLDAAAGICHTFARTADDGIQAGHDTATVLSDAFDALFDSAAAIAEPLPLRGAILRQVLDHPGRLSSILDDETPPPLDVVSTVLAQGQRRGEVRTDQPPEAFAVVLCYSVLFATRRGANLGRPAGASPLGHLALEVVLRGIRPDDHTRQRSGNERPARLGRMAP